jgi:hypothetical protein
MERVGRRGGRVEEVKGKRQEKANLTALRLKGGLTPDDKKGLAREILAIVYGCFIILPEK